MKKIMMTVVYPNTSLNMIGDNAEAFLVKVQGSFTSGNAAKQKIGARL